MNLIVAVDNNWAIGKNGKCLVSIPEDMKYFREETTGKVLIMGRKTFESLPSGPLANRTNIVLTTDKSYKAKGAYVCHSVDDVLEMIKPYDTDDVYVIGGGMVYREFLDMCDVAHITKIDYCYDADTYFPNLDKTEGWSIEVESEEKTYFDIVYEFVKYVKK